MKKIIQFKKTSHSSEPLKERRFTNVPFEKVFDVIAGVRNEYATVLVKAEIKSDTASRKADLRITPSDAFMANREGLRQVADRLPGLLALGDQIIHVDFALHFTLDSDLPK